MVDLDLGRLPHCRVCAAPTRMKGFFLKIPEGMLELWRDAAEERKVTLSQLIREAVNRDLERSKSQVPQRKF